MTKALAAGMVYFLAVFAAGFLLGTLRVLIVVPAAGEFAAILLELPAILAVAWLACRRTVRGFAVPAAAAPRLAMGASAFALVMAAEFVLAVFAFGLPAGEYAASFLTPAGAPGLAGQVLFALFPLIQGRRRQG